MLDSDSWPVEAAKAAQASAGAAQEASLAVFGAILGGATMGDFRKWGPYFSTLNSRILIIIRTPK